MTIAPPTEGQGEGSVRFSVGANAEPASRSANIAVNDQRLEISQAGKPCELIVSSNHESVDGAGGNLSVNVRASADSCEWTATSNASWISIVSGPAGRGNGTVSFHVDGVTGPPRTGYLTIAGQNVQVDQGTACSFTVATDTFSVDAAGGERQVAVTAPAGCSWTAQSPTPWITITSSATGSGSGLVVFRVAASDGPGRTGTIVVAGRTITVTQSLGCSVTVATDTFSVDAAGGEQQVAVTAAAGCSWTAQSQTPWITITSSAAGSGSGMVVFRVAASDGPGRTGAVVVAGRTITVTQALGCSYSIAPSSINVGAQAGSTAIQVAAGGGCAWTATSAVPWISIASAGNGNGPGQVQVAVAANDGPGRSATIAIAGRSLTVTQASGCTYTVAPTSQDVPGDGGNVVASVTTGAGCSWSATSSVDWITLAYPGDGGTGQVRLTVKPNASPPRTGTVTIAGRTFTVNQASLCTWSFSPPSHDFPPPGGNGNVLVLVSGACSWTAVPNVPWIQITAGGSGTGPGLLQFVVPRNSGASRTGMILIGGQNYVVRQQ